VTCRAVLAGRADAEQDHHSAVDLADRDRSMGAAARETPAMTAGISA
jgi:hypothetical protein